MSLEIRQVPARLEFQERSTALEVRGGLSAPGGVRSVVHGSDPNFPRPDTTQIVLWSGSIQPNNWISDDIWFRA